MKKIIYVFAITSFITSCKINTAQSVFIDKNDISISKIDTLLIDNISIRAIEIDENKVWYVANSGKIGNIDLLTKIISQTVITKDTFKLEFRSIATTKNEVFALNVSNPALLFKIDKKTMQRTLVYEEMHEKVFYDAMRFWNDKEGIAIGDPTETCLSILITRDGGNSWKKSKCSNLFEIEDGEAAFAASNTNIVTKGNKTWVVSGGKKARVFFSDDKGKSWKVNETPIIQGSAMTGIFTADFFDDKIGIIAGGDYEKPTQNFGNKAITKDGGLHWNLIAENNGFGYASCIQYFPNSQGKKLICVGATGIFASKDSGNTWQKIHDDISLYTIRFQNQNTAIAAGKNKVIRIKF